jgi:Pirin
MVSVTTAPSGLEAEGSRRGVTYMIDGILQHQDSNGGGGLITDGDTQWLTAGAGLSLCLR